MSSSTSEEMVFDFATRKLVPASSIWASHAATADVCIDRAQNRITDLDVLLHDLAEAKMIADVREHTVVAKIDDELETLIHILRRKAAELTQQVKDSTAQQKAQLDALAVKATEARKEVMTLATHVDSQAMAKMVAGDEASASFASSSSNLIAAGGNRSHNNKNYNNINTDKVSVHVRLDSLFKLEENLSRPLFFDVPPQQLFSVVTRGFDLDQFIVLNKVAVPMRVPPSLAVRMTNNAEVSIPFEPSARGPFGVAPGMFHYLGTGGRSTVFTNPLEQSLVFVGGVDFIVGSAAHLLRDPTARESVSHRPSRTRSVRDGRIVFDFGDLRRVCIDSYSLQHGHEERHASLRSWKVVGSNDGETWFTLDERTEEEVLGSRPFNTALFELTVDDADMDLPDFMPPSASPLRTFYRYIALVITGSNSAGQGNFHIEIGHVELYGRIRMC